MNNNSIDNKQAMNTKKIFSIVIMISLLFSCSDILEENPPSFITIENFFQNEADAESSVIAAYSFLYVRDETIVFSISGTDVALARNDDWPAGNYRTQITPADGRLERIWNPLIDGLATANSVIVNLENSSLDSSITAQFIAEAKFLRAWYYFYLVQFWGDAPLVTEPQDNLKDIFESQKRVPVAEIYDQLIIPDLLGAANTLPTSYADTNKGRATVDAANTLLAKVYAVTRNWQGVIDATQQVISGGRYDILADYADLFRGSVGEFQAFPNKDGVLVEERIFDVQYKTDERGTNIHTQFGDLASLNPRTNSGAGWSNVLPTIDFFNSFDTTDNRRDISFFINNETDGGATSIQGADENAPNYPTVDVVQDDGTVVTVNTRPYTTKYLNPGVEQTLNNADVNLNILRYGDVLLLRAEAENELNGPATAYQYINAVRERAGLPELSGLDQNSFHEAIIDERAWELGMEGHRKQDLLRWGILEEKVNAISVDQFYVSSLTLGNGFQPHYILYPIPLTAIDASRGNLTQNPGY